MTGRVGVIDYGASGNLASVVSALEYAGGNVSILRTSKDFSDISHLVLPGVGSFRGAIDALNNSDLRAALEEAATHVPTLGICVGMQIMASLGYEFGETSGLDLVGGEVKKMQAKGTIPHIGFNSVQWDNSPALFKNISASSSFYFMHSYEMVNYTNVIGLTSYSGHQFVSAINKDNIYGVQFHPEKSREPGIQVLRNFISL